MALQVAEYAFFALLVVEIVVGVVAWGLIGRGGLLRRSNFHVLDLAIFVICVADLGLQFFSGMVLLPVHSLRFLRIAKFLFQMPVLRTGRILLQSLSKACKHKALTYSAYLSGITFRLWLFWPCFRDP